MSPVLLLILQLVLLAGGCSCCQPSGQGGRPLAQPTPPAAKATQSAPASPAVVAPAGSTAAAALQRTPAPPWPTTATSPPEEDRGIFSQLSSQVHLQFPGWLAAGPVEVVALADGAAPLLYAAGAFVGYARQGAEPDLRLSRLGQNDRDGDGIPDRLDLLIGAKKAALNGARYTEGYVRIPYPGGDVPAHRGVCTDVVIRALRNAGIDLQRELHQDLRRAPRAYPMVRRPDANIDHRRVRTLLPYFKRHWHAQRPAGPGQDALLLPGDLVLLDTLGDPRPDHLGILSDRLGASGYPLVINNWTVGYQTSEMDLLGSVPITHRFRLPARPLPWPAAARGLSGLLDRHELALPGSAHQLIVVSAPLWSSSRGTMRRLERRGAADGWRQVGRPLPVRLGQRGLGWGLGLHGEPPAASTLRLKQEGDHRSPAGIFELGNAFGPSSRSPYRGRWPWRQAGPQDYFVDDPGSPHYNSWQRLESGAEPPWRSAEALARYRLGLVVQHNMDPTQPGRGSAIFLHLDEDDAPTVGCTALQRPDLLALLRWLDPNARPLLIQLPGSWR